MFAYLSLLALGQLAVTAVVVPIGHGDTRPQASTGVRALPIATSPVGLSQAAKAAGKLYFGSATDNYHLTDGPYISILSDQLQFNQITPGNSMKWDATEPRRGVFNFAGGDEIVAFARKSNQLVRGHTCVWHSQLAPWVTQGNFDNSTLQQIVKDHTTAVVSHWKGQMYAWDVVNEIFNEDGTFRQSVFLDTIGPSYVEVAFRAAREADPSAKLYLNDYNIDGLGAKSTGVVNLVRSLKSSNVPIDGIGLQAHLIVGSLPPNIQENLEQFTNLGVEVAITELDIRMTLPVTPEKLEQQRKDYASVIGACNAVKGCVGVTIWDFTDKYSWIPSVFAGEGVALPWDENLERKPAYDGIIQGFTGQVLYK
ncbi:endo-1,4-beta-xylanase A precursor [Pluteus cervinus]|uniref:Endo-1,4-beta-xylanase A n=1 Tax=Pluteus cervinus TaxID=181527 RepID=A0ACD3B738_9AGAR|nr:endo-1,4-beta-xylanase A precursor [Pluteus cervinus]